MTDDAYSEQEIRVPLLVGSRVHLSTDVSVDKEDGDVIGGTADTIFEDYVETYCSDTGLLEFEDSDVGLQEFRDLLDEADSITVVNEETVATETTK